ncbi:MAG: glutamate synthase subunit beta [Clostridia bacterium]
MGSNTGFLDFERKGNFTIEAAKRILNFDEFHTNLSVKDRINQGGRCMNCGVAFCQSGMILNGMRTGCPLNNLIPEWNDEIYNSNWEHALSRLLKTNNFPEFTGRVCPALCENACTCSINDDAVTVRDNELSIIEYAFANDLIKASVPEIRTDKKIAVIGSGPAGLAVADQLNKRGHNVTVYERDDRIGGLLMYGIPNMKLDKKIVQRRVDLMIAQGVKFITGYNLNSKSKGAKLKNEYDAVVLCCGSRKARDIFSEKTEADGIYYAVDFLASSTKSLLNNGMIKDDYVSAKDKNVVVVGGGDTGNDCVGTCIRHGCKSVVQVEMMPEPPKERQENNPWPEYPRNLKVDYGQEEAIHVFGNDPRVYKTTIKSIVTDEMSNKLKAVVTVMVEFKFDEELGRSVLCEIEGSEKTIEADLLLIAAGFVGCEDRTANSYSIELSDRNNVPTENYMTSADGVFAAGDVKMGQSLVVTAIADGRKCAKRVDFYLMGYSNMIG